MPQVRNATKNASESTSDLVGGTDPSIAPPARLAHLSPNNIVAGRTLLFTQSEYNQFECYGRSITFNLNTFNLNVFDAQFHSI